MTDPNNLQKTKKFDLQFKILAIGDSEVGKTSIIDRFASGEFNSKMITTIGVEFKVKIIELDGLKIKLQIWDTAGQERYKAITSAFFRDTMGVFMVYDVTSTSSFNSITEWAEKVEKNSPPHCVRILLANKCDLSDARQISKEQGEELASRFNISFFETSAKENINIQDAFIKIAQEIKRLKVTPEQEEKMKKNKDGHIDLKDAPVAPDPKHSKCCN
jgi:small GTP-binding protein